MGREDEEEEEEEEDVSSYWMTFSKKEDTRNSKMKH